MSGVSELPASTWFVFNENETYINYPGLYGGGRRIGAWSIETAVRVSVVLAAPCWVFLRYMGNVGRDSGRSDSRVVFGNFKHIDDNYDKIERLILDFYSISINN